MSDSSSERRLAENEVIFREVNEQIRHEVAKNFGRIAKDLPLEFYCECANENCRERISLPSAEFRVAHSSDKHFIVKRGHIFPKVEHLIDRRENYDIIEKYETPPLGSNSQLHKT